MITSKHDGDSGFGLVETVVSMTVAAIVLAALGGLLLTATKAGVVSRADSNASNVLNEQVEKLRAAEYAALSMRSGDATIAADTAIDQTGSPWVYQPTGEPLVVATVGAVQHELVETRNDVTFTTRRYVMTVPSDTTGTYKRIVLVTRWSLFGQPKSRQVDTIVTATQRGLPLPRFDVGLSTTSPQPVGTGTTVAWGMWIRNAGARDGWNVASDDGRTDWVYVNDLDADGVLDAIEESSGNRLGDYDANGVRDTGLLENGQTLHLIAYRPVSTSEGGTVDVNFSYSSVAQPPPASAAKLVPTRMTVTGPAAGSAQCASGSPCTLTSYYLDQRQNGHLASENPNVLSENASNLQAALYNYSAEVSPPGAGRLLLPGGVGPNDQTLLKVADFRFQVPNGQTRSYLGTASLSIQISCEAARTVTLTAYAGTSGNGNMNNFTSLANGSSAVSCTGSNQWVSVSVPLSTALNANKYVTLRLYSSGDAAIRLNYDATTATSAIILPRTS